MEPETENNAIARAKADLADFDRRIAVTKAEEDRLASERQRMEIERGKVASFLEMYDKYAGHSSDATGKMVADAVVRVQSEASKSDGSDHAAPTLRRGNGAIRHSRKRRPPLHRKPPGTPTTHDMILTALRDAQSRGETGLAPRQIADFIRQKWWPHLKGSSVGPAAWRMYHDKQIRKEGDLYAPLAS
jgi:hypothetical protein